MFNHGPCIPEIDYPYGENLQLTIESVPPQDDAAKYQKPDHDLDTIGDLFAELRSCWSPPPADTAREGMQMSVRFSFKRSGEIIAAPRMTFATAGVSADIRDTYLKAINASLDACMPLKFTGGLGGALAGRPIAIRYVDNRELRQSHRNSQVKAAWPPFNSLSGDGDARDAMHVAASWRSRSASCDGSRFPCRGCQVRSSGSSHSDKTGRTRPDLR